MQSYLPAMEISPTMVGGTFLNPGRIFGTVEVVSHLLTAVHKMEHSEKETARINLNRPLAHWLKNVDVRICITDGH